MLICGVWRYPTYLNPNSTPTPNPTPTPNTTPTPNPTPTLLSLKSNGFFRGSRATVPPHFLKIGFSYKYESK